MPTPKYPDLISFAVPVEIRAAQCDDGEEKKGPRAFHMEAYTGVPMQLSGWQLPVIVDLAGLKGTNKSKPILRDHDASRIVGHTTLIGNDRKTLAVDGVISGTGPDAVEVTATHDNGFPWQASIGARPDRVVELAEGKTAIVNGQEITGPVYIARKSTLAEISFVARGADDNTSACIAATAAEQTEELPMAEEKTVTQETPVEAKAVEVDIAAKMRQDAAAEARRIDSIRSACGTHGEICAKAIEENWTAEKAEMEVLKAERPKAPAAHVADNSINASMLEAAIRLGGSESQKTVEAGYKPEILDAAHKYRNMGLKRLIQIQCQMQGRDVPEYQDNRAMEAAFSTINMATVLGATANKVMWAAYQAVPGVARTVAKKLSANNFQTHTGARMTGDFTMLKVGPDGELKHAAGNQETFTYSVATYGRMFGVTRQDIVNDDLGVFTGIPQSIGRGAALAIEQAFWTLVLANTGTYFGSGNANYISGSTTPLDETYAHTALSAAVKTFRQMTDADGHPIMVEPKYLLVPPELEEMANRLYVSTNLNTGGSSTAATVPNRSVWTNKFQPLVSPYLSNSAYTGYSTTAWYLFADPADVAAFGIAYLGGIEQPTVEDAPMASNILGQGWRGYIDFGVCQIDKHGAVKSKGAA